MSSIVSQKVPKAFVLRRLHSLLGLWLVVYLFEHLITNSQAALWLGEKGEGFIHMVNFLQSLPYLHVIEIILLGVPIGFHGYLGIKYALTSKANSHKTDGSTPDLKKYGRNHAYSWQRITSWILVFGILFHVGQMRFYLKPKEVIYEGNKFYLVPLSFDEKLYHLGPRLKVQFWGLQEIENIPQNPSQQDLSSFVKIASFKKGKQKEIKEEVQLQNYHQWIHTLKSFSIKPNEVVAACPNPGTAILLTTRDTFKSPWMGVFYTLFLFSAVFHAGNGFWSFLLSWGAILSLRCQKKWVNVSWALTVFLAFLGLAAIWGSYWINL